MSVLQFLFGGEEKHTGWQKVWILRLCKKGNIPSFTLNLFQQLDKFQPEKTVTWIESFQLHALFLPDTEMQMQMKYFNSSKIPLKTDLWQGTISTLMHLTSVEVHPSVSNPKFSIYVRMFFGCSSATHTHKIELKRWSYHHFFYFNL